MALSLSLMTHLQCGKMPFARIAAEWTHENQTVSDDLAQQIARRAEPPTVRGITIDTQWHKIDPNQYVCIF